MNILITISEIFAGAARCFLFSVCSVCLLIGGFLMVQSIEGRVGFFVYFRTIDPSYDMCRYYMPLQLTAACVFIILGLISLFGVLTPRPRWFPWSLPWAFLCAFLAAILYTASVKLKVDMDHIFSKDDVRANFVAAFPKNCVVLDAFDVHCPNMWPDIRCVAGTLTTPDSHVAADAATLWRECGSGWREEIERFGNRGAVFLAITASFLWTAVLAGILRILAVKRTMWHQSYAALHEQVLVRLIAEWVESGEQILCVAQKDLQHADFETLRFLGIAFLSIIGLPFAILYLPIYLEKKRQDYVESVLFLTQRRLLLKKGCQHTTVSCKLGAIKSLSLTVDGMVRTRLFNMGSFGLEVKLKQAHVLRGMPSCDTLLLPGISNAEEFIRHWKQIAPSVPDAEADGCRDQPLLQSPRRRAFSSDSICESMEDDFMESPHLSIFSVPEADTHVPHSYWTSHKRLQPGRPEIMGITVIPHGEAERRWKVHNSQTYLSVHLRFEGMTWQVYRRPMDFVSLHLTLASKLRFRGGWMQDFPKLPKRFWSKLLPKHVDDIDELVLSTLHAYIDECFQLPAIRDSPTFANFVEVSTFSFKGNLGVKLREGYVWKRVNNLVKCGGVCFVCRTCVSKLPVQFFNCATCKAQWRKRWMVLRQDHLIFLEDQRSSNNSSVLMFDSTLVVKAGGSETNYHDGLIFSTHSTDLILRCVTSTQSSLWKEAVEDEMQKSPFCQVQPYGSSFPPRQGCSVELLCDGGPYFRAVYEALEEAETDIYICDWWLTPDLSLLRGTELEVENSRIVNVLKRRAEAGVKIFIHLYKEMPKILYTDSSYAKILLSRHENISVLRHPDHGLFSEGKMIWLWSHHEKVICIDQKVAFVGGIDLCLGRYDTDRHHLSDTGGGSTPAQFPGKDYSNPQIKDFTEVRFADIDLISRFSEPRMPWHDVSLRLEGPVVFDIARNFLELWNHVIRDKDHKNVCMRKHEPHIHQSYTSSSEDIPEPSSPRTTTSFIMHARDMGDRLASFGKKVHRRGRRALASLKAFDDDAQFYDSNITNADQQSASIELPRPRVTKNLAKEDLSGPLLHPFTRGTENDLAADTHLGPFTEGRPNTPTQRVYSSRHRHTVTSFHGQIGREGKLLEGKLMEEAMEQVETSASDAPRKRSSIGSSHGSSGGANDDSDFSCSEMTQKHQRSKDWHPLYPNLRAKSTIRASSSSAPVPIHRTSSRATVSSAVVVNNIQVQLLRTCANWSYGTCESSVHECYRRLITAAKQFIYIENQFFVTSTHRTAERNGATIPVRNKIGQALVDRILQAAQRGENFRVYVVLPAMPGFECKDLRHVDAYNLRYIMWTQYLSICRGPNSIISTLEAELPRCGLSASTWRDYIGFYCLKHAGQLPDNTLRAGQIYVHSKVLIVDDEQMICGSANINDRSLIIGRDSEMCVLVTSKRFVSQARQRLWHEHFGLLGGNDIPPNAKEVALGLQMPLSVVSWTLWQTFGKNNATSMYENLGYWPSSAITTYEQLRETMNHKLVQASNTFVSDKVHHCGRISEFPYHFLEKENMLLPAPLSASLASYYLILV
eukprot:GEMP01001438.1.p1 GENE.GEMP01001438.1~~GEMP01001438.1.p1  ORF type:complete len:1567 (+),score=295.26 GEMP01001438.1:413-5113(+)